MRPTPPWSERHNREPGPGDQARDEQGGPSRPRWRLGLQARPRSPEGPPRPSPAAQGLTLSRELSDTVHELLQGRRHVSPRRPEQQRQLTREKAAALGGGAAPILHRASTATRRHFRRLKHRESTPTWEPVTVPMETVPLLPVAGSLLSFPFLFNPCACKVSPGI